MERQAITVEGIVQGVGFRPFVYALATRLKLCGFVKNQSGRVLIEAEGSRPALDRFTHELRENAPPLARVDALSCESRALRGEDRFRIEPSEDDHGSPIFISPDVATCDDCLAELFDPWDRHYRYPFLNCTNCGPRLTIIRGAPYDRTRSKAVCKTRGRRHAVARRPNRLAVSAVAHRSVRLCRLAARACRRIPTSSSFVRRLQSGPAGTRH